MSILQITSREFRERQKAFFDLADKGEKVIIKRGKKQAYVLTPINDDDLYFTPEMLSKIDKAVQEASEGETFAMNPGESLDEFLDRVENV